MLRKFYNFKQILLTNQQDLTIINLLKNQQFERNENFMIKIISDSACDITQEEALKLGIVLLPMKISFNENESYLDGKTITGKHFYEKLIESDKLPKTSMISPFEFEQVFNKYNDDEIICITISSKLSGTYNSALIAKEDFKNVNIIDSLNATIGQGLLVKLACNLVSKGKSVKEICSLLNEYKHKIRMIGLVDTLEYLKKGGRIKASTAVLGGMLHIKPVIEVKNGEVVILGKARGSKQGNNKLRESIKSYGGINFNMPYSIAYTGLDSSLLDKYINDSKDLYN